MNTIDALSWLATFFTLFGSVLMVKKKNSSWLFYLIGSILWTVYAIVTHQTALIATDVIFVALNVWGMIAWRSESGPPNS